MVVAGERQAEVRARFGREDLVARKRSVYGHSDNNLASGASGADPLVTSGEGGEDVARARLPGGMRGRRGCPAAFR